MKKEENIDLLIENLISGNITKEDKKILFKWSKEKEENKKLLAFISANKDFKKRLSDYYDLRSPIYWNSLQSRIKIINRKSILHKGLKVAAAILLPLVLGTLVYILGTDKDVDYLEVAKEIKPGAKNATLLISGTKAISLDTLEVGRISMSTNLSIIKESKGKISYKQLEFNKQTLPLKNVYHTINVARGEEYSVELSDGTVVWLNSESKLIYPAIFNGDHRELRLEKGEAYFEVAHDPQRKFILTTPKSIIEVKGTSFNVSAYEEETIETTTLTEGCISIRHRFDVDHHSSIDLKPGDQARSISINRKIKVSQVDAEQYSLWKDGIFYFHYESIGSIAKRLGRWYKVDFNFESEAVKSIVFYGKIKRYERLDKILEMLRLTEKVNFTIDNNVVKITKE